MLGPVGHLSKLGIAHSSSHFQAELCLGRIIAFRKGPGQICRFENLSEFRELAWIWESSLWQSHSNRAPGVHLQDRSRPKSERVVADSGRSSTQCSTNLPDFGLAPSGERHKLDRTSTGPGCIHVPWKSSGEVASLGRVRSTGGGRGGRPVQNRWKSSQLFNFAWSATRSERFLNFDRGPTGPCKSLQIPRRICQFS